jgi:hypothetical protein
MGEGSDRVEDDERPSEEDMEEFRKMILEDYGPEGLGEGTPEGQQYGLAPEEDDSGDAPRKGAQEKDGGAGATGGSTESDEGAGRKASADVDRDASTEDANTVSAKATSSGKATRKA